jgi:acyl carrier protein
MNAQLEQEVCRLVEDVLNLERGAVVRTSSMASLQGWDSLQHLGIVLALEEEFHCDVTPEELPSATSVEALIELVQRKREVSQAG